MKLKLAILGTAAVVAVGAMAIPVAAGADTLVLTDPPGTVVPLGLMKLTKIKTKVTKTALGTIECGVWNFENEITKNGPTGFEEVGVGSETGECSAEGEPVTITELTTTSATSTTMGSGVLGLSFTVDVGPFECPFSGEVEFTYLAGSDVVHIEEELESAFELCESEAGKPVYDFTGTRETKDGTPITVSLKK